MLILWGFLLTKSESAANSKDEKIFFYSWALDPKGFKRVSDDHPEQTGGTRTKDAGFQKCKKEPENLKVSEGRCQIEEFLRILKTDFSARPVYLQDENRIKAHFLICFLALAIYRFLEEMQRFFLLITVKLLTLHFFILGGYEKWVNQYMKW